MAQPFTVKQPPFLRYFFSLSLLPLPAFQFILLTIRAVGLFTVGFCDKESVQSGNPAFPELKNPLRGDSGAGHDK